MEGKRISGVDSSSSVNKEAPVYGNEMHERSFFLYLLKKGLWGKDYEDKDYAVPDDFHNAGNAHNWDYIMKCAKKQTVSGLVSEGINSLPVGMQPDMVVKKKMQFSVVKNMQVHEVMNKAIVTLKKLLRREGIDCVLLKGQGVARLYRTPNLRQCGDIDIYVGADNYKRACAVMDDFSGKLLCNSDVYACEGGNKNVKEPGKDRNKDSESRHTDKHYHIVVNGLPVEIHKYTMKLQWFVYNRRFRAFEKEYLDNGEKMEIELGEDKVSIPPVFFNAVFIFLHAWGHIIEGGLGLRQICDWTMLMHRYGKMIDEQLLKDKLKSMGVLKGWIMFGYIAVNYLGLSIDECPLYSGKYKKEASLLMDLIWEDGNFGFFSDDFTRKRPEVVLVRKMDTLLRILKRSRKIYSIDKFSSLLVIRHGVGYGISNIF